ncbi:MAG: phosphoribosyltransferase family protein [Planctomycetes bacterium]|nr:phosphoribosyltransferase family protein [Planctomycetota bacterium]
MSGACWPQPLITAAQLARRVAALGAACAAQLAAEREPLALIILDGAAVFAADLLRHCPLPQLTVASLRVASYGQGTAPQGVPRVVGELPPLRGRTVLVIDDILDTGLTLACVQRALREAGAARLVTCVLLDKPARRHPAGLARADLVGFTIPPRFVVGYGLDHGGRWRHLPYLGALPA